MYKVKSDEVWETNQFIIITCDADVTKHVSVSVFEDKDFEGSKMLIKSYQNNFFMACRAIPMIGFPQVRCMFIYICLCHICD